MHRGAQAPDKSRAILCAAFTEVQREMYQAFPRFTRSPESLREPNASVPSRAVRLSAKGRLIARRGRCSVY